MIDQFNQPASRVRVSLWRKGSTTPACVTHTAEDGEFVLDGLLPGAYLLQLKGSCYETAAYPVFIRKCRDLTHLGAVRIRKRRCSGTLHGIITDPHGRPVPGALVVLFDGSDNTPLQFTRTNGEGVYLFYNLPPGCYFIKSKR